MQHKVRREVGIFTLFSVFVAKTLGITLQIVPKNSATIAKKMVILSRNVLADLLRNLRQHISVGPSSTGSPMNAAATRNAPTPIQPVTPELIQQMIISAFSTLGLLRKPFPTSPTWYFDYRASNHMTNNAHFLANTNKYSGNLKIHTADGSHLPITTIGDISSSLTDVFVSPGLTTELISVGQLVDNNCNVPFSKSGCVVQDQQSRRTIAKGPKVGHLFLSNFLFLHISHCPLSLAILLILITKHGINVSDIQTILFFLIC